MKAEEPGGAWRRLAPPCAAWRRLVAPGGAWRPRGVPAMSAERLDPLAL